MSNSNQFSAVEYTTTDFLQDVDAELETPTFDGMEFDDLFAPISFANGDGNEGDEFNEGDKGDEGDEDNESNESSVINGDESNEGNEG